MCGDICKGCVSEADQWLCGSETVLAGMCVDAVVRVRGRDLWLWCASVERYWHRVYDPSLFLFLWLRPSPFLSLSRTGKSISVFARSEAVSRG